MIKKIKTKAFWRNIDGYGYNAQHRKVLWQSKKCAWNWIAVGYGIRNSEKIQRFPIWNTSNNCNRSLLFGFRFWYLEIVYHRKQSFNQKRKFFLRKRLWKFYQLFF